MADPTPALLSERLSTMARMLFAAGKPTAAEEVCRLVSDVQSVEAEVRALARMATGVVESRADTSPEAFEERERAGDHMAAHALSIAAQLGVTPGAPLRRLRPPTPAKASIRLDEEKPAARELKGEVLGG